MTVRRPLRRCVVAEGDDDNHDAYRTEIVQLCVDQLGSYKKPGIVELRTDPLPKSPVGKVQRRTLREPYWQGVDRRVGGV